MKPRRVRAMSMTIQSSIKARMLEAQSKASKDPEIPEWKWEKITMDFITRFPRTGSGHDAIWAIIIARNSVPVSIISDRDNRFTSRFWQSLRKALGTQLNMSTAYHPQTDGQSERTIKTLEDMLRSGAIDFGGSWDTHLPLVEFSYNNSYHSSVKCAPFEALYGRKYRTPTAWAKVGENKLNGPEIIQETTDKIVQIKERLKTCAPFEALYGRKYRTPTAWEKVGENKLNGPEIIQETTDKIVQIKERLKTV
uniref:Reverse transcriptase domain-containing protein n=1 Tax=Tanacetum cinerariifolium TaxID=118510 RepID=A0A6L2J504_TANCI|nr:reverse transcriptase domain-containing protein [Tanacetum cinerariifolium]